MSDAEHGGPWTESDHLDGYYFDEPMAAEMVQVLAGKGSSVLDIGCGLGPYLRVMARSFPGPCVGVEPSIALRGKLWEIRKLNFLDRAQAETLGHFDLVICIEVAEHVPLARHRELFDHIAMVDPAYVVFSGATRGQTGLGHVACRDENEWVREFLRRGYRRNRELAQRLRRRAYWGWFQTNINVYYRVG